MRIVLSGSKVWYHISNTWSGSSIIVKPRLGRIDDPTEPKDQIPFIAVAPTFVQCLVALGAWRDYDKIDLWKTTGKPKPADWVFDYKETDEHRFYEPTKFTKVISTTPDKLISMGVPDTDFVGKESVVLKRIALFTRALTKIPELEKFQ